MKPIDNRMMYTYKRGLSFKYSTYKSYSTIIFRYQYQFESQELVQKVLKFIVDLVSNYTIEIDKKQIKSYYLEEVNGKFEMVDKNTFLQNEGKYLTKLGIPHRNYK